MYPRFALTILADLMAILITKLIKKNPETDELRNVHCYDFDTFWFNFYWRNYLDLISNLIINFNLVINLDIAIYIGPVTDFGLVIDPVIDLNFVTNHDLITDLNFVTDFDLVMTLTVTLTL